MAASTAFGRHQRKIEPWAVPNHPGGEAGYDALEAWSRAKAASMNQHLIGYGELAESEDCDELVADTIEEYGSLDCLVNSAGIIFLAKKPPPSCSGRCRRQNVQS